MPGAASSSGPGTLREFVLAGPGAGIDAAAAAGSGPLSVLAAPERVDAALATAGHGDKRRGLLGAAVSTVLVLGLCLYCPEGYAAVLGRLWPLLTSLDPALVMSGPASAPALSQARSRLPAGVLRAVLEAGAQILGVEPEAGQRMFGLLLSAVDGTVFDLPATDAIKERFAVPAGGRFPQPRVVTLVACGPAGSWPPSWTRPPSASRHCGTASSPACGQEP
jgi:hypothetical protein